MKHIRFPLLAATFVVSLACGGGSDGPSDTAGDRLQDVPRTEIRVDPNVEGPLTWTSGYTDGARLVIRTHEEWAAAWTTTFANQQTQPPLPVVDFERELVVLAATGLRSSGGFVIAIPNAAEEAGLVRVSVVETTPGTDCLVSTELTSPAVAVRIPRPGAEVAFVEATTVHSCSR